MKMEKGHLRVLEAIEACQPTASGARLVEKLQDETRWFLTALLIPDPVANFSSHFEPDALFLYLRLRKLEHEGWVTGAWENNAPPMAGKPRRRYYTVSETGVRALALVRLWRTAQARRVFEPR